MTCLGLVRAKNAMILNGKLSLPPTSQWPDNEACDCLSINASIVVDGT